MKSETRSSLSGDSTLPPVHLPLILYYPYMFRLLPRKDRGRAAYRIKNSFCALAFSKCEPNLSLQLSCTICNHSASFPYRIMDRFTTCVPNFVWNPLIADSAVIGKWHHDTWLISLLLPLSQAWRQQLSTTDVIYNYRDTSSQIWHNDQFISNEESTRCRLHLKTAIPSVEFINLPIWGRPLSKLFSLCLNIDKHFTDRSEHMTIKLSDRTSLRVWINNSPSPGQWHPQDRSCDSSDQFLV